MSTEKIKFGMRGNAKLFSGNLPLIGFILILVAGVYLSTQGQLNLPPMSYVAPAGMPQGVFVQSMDKIAQVDGGNKWSVEFNTAGGSNVVGSFAVDSSSSQATTTDGKQPKYDFAIGVKQDSTSVVYPIGLDYNNVLRYITVDKRNDYFTAATCGCKVDGWWLGQECQRTSAIREDYSPDLIPYTCTHTLTSNVGYVGHTGSDAGDPHIQTAGKFYFSSEKTGNVIESVSWAGTPGQTDTIKFQNVPVEITQLGYMFSGYTPAETSNLNLIYVAQGTAAADTICAKMGMTAPCKRLVSQSSCFIPQNLNAPHYSDYISMTDTTYIGMIASFISGKSTIESEKCDYVNFPPHAWNNYVSGNVPALEIVVPKTVSYAAGHFVALIDASWLGVYSPQTKPDLLSTSGFGTSQISVNQPAKFIGYVKNIGDAQGTFTAAMTCTKASITDGNTRLLQNVAVGATSSFEMNVRGLSAGTGSCIVNVWDVNNQSNKDSATYVLNVAEVCSVTTKNYEKIGYNPDGSCFPYCDSTYVRSFCPDATKFKVNPDQCTCEAMGGPELACTTDQISRSMVWRTDLTPERCDCLADQTLQWDVTSAKNICKDDNQCTLTCSVNEGLAYDSDPSGEFTYLKNIVDFKNCNYACCIDENKDGACDYKEAQPDDTLLYIIVGIAIIIVGFLLFGKDIKALMGKKMKRR